MFVTMHVTLHHYLLIDQDIDDVNRFAEIH